MHPFFVGLEVAKADHAKVLAKTVDLRIVVSKFVNSVKVSIAVKAQVEVVIGWCS